MKTSSPSDQPQYAIIASCEVAAAMMEPPGGTALVEESIRESLDFLRAMRKVDEEYGRDWWFKVWGPERLAAEGMGRRDDWLLRANEKWHGFGDLATGFNILYPIKATVSRRGSTSRAGSRRRESRRRSSRGSSPSTA